MAKTKVTMTPNQISESWGNRMKNSVTKIQNGINAITESPMAKAAAKQEKMLTNLTRAVQSGSWAAGLNKVSLADWKTKTSQKVAERLSGGVDAAMSKRVTFDTWLVARLNNVLPTIASMPDLTLDDNINRSAAYMRAMAQEKYKK